MTTATAIETGLVSPSGRHVADGTEMAERLAQADMEVVQDLLEDAVLQMKQGGKLNPSFYDAEGLGTIVNAAVSLPLRKLNADTQAYLGDDPGLFNALASSSLVTYGRATAEEAADILAAYQSTREHSAPTTDEKMVFLGSTVLAPDEMPLAEPQPLPTVAELLQEAWRLPSLQPMLHTMIEMPGLDSGARDHMGEELHWERMAGTLYPPQESEA